MPMYEYKCDSCGKTCEKIQKYSDAPLTECPECGDHALVKQISRGTGFCLMGYGWDKPGMHVSQKR